MLHSSLVLKQPAAAQLEVLVLVLKPSLVVLVQREEVSQLAVEEGFQIAVEKSPQSPVEAAIPNHELLYGNAEQFLDLQRLREILQALSTVMHSLCHVE